MEEPVTQGEETLWIPPSALWQTDFLRFFLAQGRQPAPRGRRSQAPFARHPDSARSPEPERRIANRSQLRSSSFESAAGKGLKSLFFFFFFLKERLFLPPLISLPVKARV